MTLRASPPAIHEDEGDQPDQKVGSAVRECLEVLEDKGKLSAEELEKAARNPRHPLHSRLTWDDQKAGYRYRLEECRAIIRSYRVEIIVNKRNVSVPVYIHDVHKGVGYVTTNSLREQSREDQDVTLHYELSRALGMLQRALVIAEAAGSPVAQPARKITNQLERLVDSIAPEEEVA